MVSPHITASQRLPREVAGIPIPDSPLALQATELLREHASQMLFDHSIRVYLFGAIRGRRQGLRFDTELLFIGSVFHDLGLTAKYRSPQHRFEVDGANAARSFMQANGIDELTAELVWDAIALHTTREIPRHKQPEIALLHEGAATDVVGEGLDEISMPDRNAVLAAYPRASFKDEIVGTFVDGIGHKPETAFGTFNADLLERALPGYRRPNFCDLIAANPFGG